GRLKATQWTSNLDLNRDFKVGLARPLNVAFGAEYPRDTYPIEAGSFAFPTLGGAASYQGFPPSHAGTHYRTNYAGYVDFAVKPRIVESGGIFGALGGTILDQSVLNAIAATGAEVLHVPNAEVVIFLNGADTGTRGADLAFDLAVDYKCGHIDWSL